MLKLKRLFALAAALTMTASCLPSALADNTEESAEVTPQILLYRDFEEYTGGNGFANNGQYGTFKMSFDNDWGWKNSTVENGRTGKGFRSNTGKPSLYNRYMPIREETNGEVYISFTSEAIEGAEQSGRTSFSDSDGWAYFVFQHGKGYSLSGYGDQKTVQNEFSEELLGLDYYKTELILDLETKVLSVYINGTPVSEAPVNSNTDFVNRNFQMYFEDGVIIDNLVMIYYPENVAAQTFSMAIDKIDADNKQLTVVMKSDVCDPDGANGSEIKAPYQVILAEEPSAEDFTVEGMTVTKIEKGDSFGKYIITVAEDIQPEKVYKVTANKTFKDTLGRELLGNTAEDYIITEPQILLYRDFEDYTGKQTEFSNGGKYGTFKMSFDNDWGWGEATPASGKTGTGFVSNNSLSYTKGSIYQSSFPESVKTGKGKVYFSITSETIPGTDNAGRFAIIGDGGHEYISFVHGESWAVQGRTWSAPGNELSEKTDYYKIDVIFDLETKDVDYYINGALIAETQWGYSDYTKFPTEYFRMLFETGILYDNLVMVYYPEKLSAPQSFSVRAGKTDAEQNSVSVFLMSDAVDSDLGASALKTAPYGITLKDLDNTAFSVEGYTVKEIKRDAAGEYVIALNEAVEEGAELTVTASDSLKDIMGASVNPEAKTAVVGAPSYKLSDTAASGGRASVTYTNTTDEAKGFVLAIASYEEDGRLSEIQFSSSTAGAGVVNKEAWISLKNGVEGKTVKTFVFDSLTGIKPIK